MRSGRCRLFSLYWKASVQNGIRHLISTLFFLSYTAITGLLVNTCGHPQQERLNKWFVRSVPVLDCIDSQGDANQSPEQHVTTCSGNVVMVKHALPFQDRVFKLAL
jgi:hypothetical protein